MKKLLLFIMLIFLSSSVFGAVNIDVSKDIHDISIDKDIIMIYNMTTASFETAELGVEDSYGKRYICREHTGSGETEINQKCLVNVNTTGIYSVYTFNNDNNNLYEYIHTFEVIDARVKGITIFLAILSLIALIGGLLLLRELLILSAILFVSSALNLIFTYKYLFTENLFIGIIAIFIFLIVCVVVITLHTLIQRN